MTEATNPTVSYHTVAVEAQTTAIDANSSLLAQLVAQGVKGEPKHPDFIQIDPTWDSQCCNSGQAVGPQRAQRYRLVRVHFSGHANNTLALYVGGTKRYEIFMTLGTPIIVPFDVIWDRGQSLLCDDPNASTSDPDPMNVDFRCYVEAFAE